MEINRQIGLVHVVWIWKKNLKNVNPNGANSLLCAAAKLRKTSVFLFFLVCFEASATHLSELTLPNQTHHHIDES